MRLLQFLQITYFDNEQKCTSASQLATTMKCAFLRDKKVIFLLILSGNTNLFLDLKPIYMQNMQKLRN